MGGTLVKVFCAWCAKEGRPAFLHQKRHSMTVAKRTACVPIIFIRYLQLLSVVTLNRVPSAFGTT
jgi:hypothetical protein